LRWAAAARYGAFSLLAYPRRARGTDVDKPRNWQSVTVRMTLIEHGNRHYSDKIVVNTTLKP
jgi:hypothetical protein